MTTIISSFDYAYDSVGNRTRVIEVSGIRVTWTYDNIYRLARERRSGANSFDITYSYDAAGNRWGANKEGQTKGANKGGKQRCQERMALPLAALEFMARREEVPVTIASGDGGGGVSVDGDRLQWLRFSSARAFCGPSCDGLINVQTSTGFFVFDRAAPATARR